MLYKFEKGGPGVVRWELQNDKCYQSVTNITNNQVLGILLDYLDNNINLVGKMHDKGTFTNIIVNIWGKICLKLKDVVETKPEVSHPHFPPFSDFTMPCQTSKYIVNSPSLAQSFLNI